LINRIYATGDNDWVELSNPSGDDLDLAALGLRLERSKTTLNPEIMMRFGNPEDGTYPGGTVIPAGGSYLIVRDEASSYYLGQADAIAVRDEFFWLDSGYSLYLGQGSISSSTDSDIIDLVGFGSDAAFFQGSAPAPAITDYYVLHRLADSGRNDLDFDLIISDDPTRPTGGDDPGTGSGTDDSFFLSQPDLYVPPVPVISDGLVDFWNFDDCYGSGRLTIGKWSCAREVGFVYENLAEPLSASLELNAISLSFYYKSGREWPRLTVRLSGRAGGYAQLSVEPGLITVEGLPTGTIFFPGASIPFDENWHQATLVVNQAEDYWAVYIDGEEKVFTGFFADLSAVADITVSGNQGSVLVDELAVWNRALAPEEVTSNYQTQRPFSPVLTRSSQLPAVLKNLWRFESDGIPTAIDMIGGVELSVPTSALTGRRHNDYALTVNYGSNLSADLPNHLAAQDISFAFWWRNTAYPRDGRAEVRLTNNESNANLFYLMASYSLLPYWLNSNYGVLGAANPDILPNDGLWHHLALVYDSYRYELRLYVDGEEKNIHRNLPFPTGEIIDRIVVSTNSDSAMIDDLAIWEGALSAAEVSRLFSQTK